MTSQHTAAAPSIHRLFGQAGLLRELSAGITVACLALPLSIAAGVLVYSPLGPEYAARGAVAGLLCAVAGGIAASIIGQSSFVSTMPTMALAIVQASSVAALISAWHGAPGVVVGLLPILVMLVGAWQLLFASTGLAHIVKFTPHPVLAGFVTGIGVLMIVQELPVFCGEHSLGAVFSNIGALRWPHPLIGIFGFGLIALMLECDRRFPNAPNMMIGLIVGSLLFHLASWLMPGVDLGKTIGAISPNAMGAFALPDLSGAGSLLGDFDALKALLFGSLTLALLGTLETFFTVRTAQQLSDVPSAPRRDIVGQGTANLVSAIAGGIVVAPSIKLSVANHHAGGRSRVSVITGGLTLLLATLLIPDIIFSLPVVVLAAILFIASLRLLDVWIIRLMREAVVPERDERLRAQLNLLIIAAVLVTTVFGEPVLGAGVGFLLSCLIFIAQMSRPIVAHRFAGDRVRSKRVRSLAHVDILRQHGGRILILELQGVLFFGNADDLAVELRELEQAIDIVILDLRRVSDLDTSGIAVLQQVARRFQRSRTILVASAVNRKFAKVVRSALGDRDQALFNDRDAALEWAENKIIHARTQEREFLELALEKADLTQGMSEEGLHILGCHLKLVYYAAGTALCRSGDAADRMWILKRGSVSIRVAGEHATLRLASLGPGCSVGEMGLLEKQPRSAEVVADEDVEAYLLTEEGFETILHEHPRIGRALLASIARQLAHRLRDTSDELRSLAH